MEWVEVPFNSSTYFEDGAPKMPAPRHLWVQLIFHDMKDSNSIKEGKQEFHHSEYTIQTNILYRRSKGRSEKPG